VTPTTALVRRPRVRGPLIVFALIVGMLLGIATAAQAHTGLASSDPAEGSTVTGPPPAVGLTFSGQVLLREVTVTGPTGAAATGGATVNGAVVTQPVALTDAGTYTVDYAVTSSDGHPVEGIATFVYAPPPPPAPTSEAPTSTLLNADGPTDSLVEWLKSTETRAGRKVA